MKNKTAVVTQYICPHIWSKAHCGPLSQQYTFHIQYGINSRRSLCVFSVACILALVLFLHIIDLQWSILMNCKPWSLHWDCSIILVPGKRLSLTEVFPLVPFDIIISYKTTVHQRWSMYSEMLQWDLVHEVLEVWETEVYCPLLVCKSIGVKGRQGLGSPVLFTVC